MKAPVRRRGPKGLVAGRLYRGPAWTTADGQVINEAEAARLAAEFEADKDALDGVEFTFPRRAGRPSLTGRTGTSPQVTSRLSPTVREQVDRLAADRDTTLSALAREALEQLVWEAG
jgi:hypothetical protein